MKENELQGVESKLFVKLAFSNMCITVVTVSSCRERRVHELEERVSHLEQQLRDVILQLDSSETKLEVSECVVEGARLQWSLIQVAGQQISSLSAENTSLKDQTRFTYSPQVH